MYALSSAVSYSVLSSRVGTFFSRMLLKKVYEYIASIFSILREGKVIKT